MLAGKALVGFGRRNRELAAGQQLVAADFAALQQHAYSRERSDKLSVTRTGGNRYPRCVTNCLRMPAIFFSSGELAPPATKLARPRPTSIETGSTLSSVSRFSFAGTAAAAAVSFLTAVSIFLRLHPGDRTHSAAQQEERYGGQARESAERYQHSARQQQRLGFAE